MAYNKEVARDRRKKRIRKKLLGSTERPRLTVFKSVNHIYAQIIDDSNGHVLASASSVAKDFTGSGGNIEAAKNIGSLLGDRASQKGIQKVVFDRNGYPYHGRVKALADAAREKGLVF